MKFSFLIIFTCFFFTTINASQIWGPKPFFVPGPPGNLIEYELETYKIGKDGHKDLFSLKLVFHFEDACKPFQNASYEGKVCHVFSPACNPYQAAYYAAEVGCQAIIMRQFFPGPAGARARLTWLDKNKWRFNNTFIPIYETAFDSINRNGSLINETIGYTFAYGGIVHINLTDDANPWLKEYDSFGFVLMQSLLIGFILIVFIFWFIVVYRKYDNLASIFKAEHRNVGTATLLLINISLVFRLVVSLDPVRSRGLYDFVSYNILPTINVTFSFVVSFLLALFYISLVQKTKKMSVKVKKCLSTPVGIAFAVISSMAAVMTIARGAILAQYKNDGTVTAGGWMSLIAIILASLFYLISGIVLYRELRRILSIQKNARDRKLSAMMIWLSGVAMLGNALPGCICIAPSQLCFFYPRKLSAMLFAQQFAMTLATLFQVFIYLFRTKSDAMVTQRSSASTLKKTSTTDKTTDTDKTSSKKSSTMEMGLSSLTTENQSDDSTSNDEDQD